MISIILLLAAIFSFIKPKLPFFSQIDDNNTTKWMLMPPIHEGESRFAYLNRIKVFNRKKYKGKMAFMREPLRLYLGVLHPSYGKYLSLKKSKELRGKRNIFWDTFKQMLRGQVLVVPTLGLSNGLVSTRGQSPASTSLVPPGAASRAVWGE